jgi:hypothetical protein
MNQKRQPKGTETGGQFALDVNAESTVMLESETILTMVVDSTPSTKYHCDTCNEVSFEEIHDCGATCREIDPSDAEDMELDEEDDGLAEYLDRINNPRPIIEQSERWISDTRENIKQILDAKAAREAGGGNTLDQLIEEGEIIDILKERIIRCQQDIVDAQRRELEGLRKDAGGFNLDRAIFDNVCSTIECRREMVLDSDEARLTDTEIEQVRVLVDAHLENGISRGGDKALGYLIEEEAEYCLIEITPKLGDILKEDE